MTTTFRNRFVLAVAILAAPVVCSGCGASGGPYYPVRGQVAIGGKPATGAVVTLVPASQAPTDGPRASARVGADGTFTFATFEGGARRSYPGARAGEYIVLVTWPPELTREGLNQNVPITDFLGGRFSDPKTSPLRAEVRRGATDLPTIELRDSDLIAQAN